MSAELQTQRDRLHEINRRVAELKGRAALVLYELGALLGEVQQSELWRVGGFDSFDAWLSGAIDVSRATAWKAMRVARHFNAGMVERYGIEKLNAGLRYLELTGADEQPGDLVAADLRVRDAQGRFRSVPFHEASYREVVEAGRLLKQVRARHSGPPGDAAAWAERVNGALASTGGTARLRTRKDGAVLVDLRGVPLDQIAALAAALVAGEE